ncbi:MAG: protein jag [Clostridia bacterium]|nr:protein jag [Clostridia bacterium]
MNIQSIEATGKNIELATKNALKKLGVDNDGAEIVVLFEGTMLKPAKVRATIKRTDSQKAQEYLTTLLEKMQFEHTVSVSEQDGEIHVSLLGDGGGAIIGHRGEVLNSIQYLTSLAVNADKEDFVRVVVDAENYRAKRTIVLEQLAKNLEKKVIRTRRDTKLEPMNPYERRVIHSTLQGSQYVSTESVGEEPNRCVIIKLKGRKATATNITENTAEQEQISYPTSAKASSRKKLIFAYRSDKKRR